MKDFIVRGMTRDGYIKITAAQTTGMVERARQIHNASPLAAAALGRTLTAVSMMGNDLSIKKAQFVLSRIMREKISSIKRWELAKLCRGKYFKGSETIQPTLELLESYGYIRMEEAEAKTGPGRKSDVTVIVNPEVYLSEEKTR